jgi:hypothetical protein
MLISPRRKILLCACLFATSIALGTGLVRVAAKSATEAPAGFNTPSFNGQHSISNGIVEPPGDTFALDQQVYEENETVASGLGPVYNATSCVVCHQNPNSGAASQITNFGLDTMMPMAILSTRQSLSTTARTRLPAGRLSTIALSVRRRRNTSPRRKTFVHYAPPSILWGTDLWRPSTIRL